MKPVYTQTVTSTGGGRDGHVKGEGGIDFKVAGPKVDGAVNPESLLAAAWAACFNGALQKTMKEAGVDVEAHQPSVDASVTLNEVESGFRLSGEIVVTFTDKDSLENSDQLVADAHAFCPFSKALSGDMEIAARAA